MKPFIDVPHGMDCPVCRAKAPGLLETWRRWRVYRLELKLAKHRELYSIRICMEHSQPTDKEKELALQASVDEVMNILEQLK